MATGIVTLTPPLGLFEELEDDDSELLATTAPPRSEQSEDAAEDADATVDAEATKDAPEA